MPGTKKKKCYDIGTLLQQMSAGSAVARPDEVWIRVIDSRA